jgi:hypothetical protein
MVSPGALEFPTRGLHCLKTRYEGISVFMRRRLRRHLFAGPRRAIHGSKGNPFDLPGPKDWLERTQP